MELHLLPHLPLSVKDDRLFHVNDANWYFQTSPLWQMVSNYGMSLAKELR